MSARNVSAAQSRRADRPGEIEFLLTHFNADARAHGLTSPARTAEFLNMDHGSYSRITRGLRPVGAAFIVRVLTAPWDVPVTFERYFRCRPEATR